MENFKYDLKTRTSYFQHSLFVVVFSLLSFSLVLATIIISLFANDFIIYTILKGMASLSFVVIGAYSLFKLKTSQTLNSKHFIFLGFLFVCFISDIAININFISGMATFFIAQCLFIWFCTYIYKINFKKSYFLLVAYVPILVLINVLFGLKIFEQNTIIWIFTNIYGITLLTSFLYSIIIFYKNQNYVSLTIMLSLLLFVCSDLSLMFEQFLVDKYKVSSVYTFLNCFVLSSYYLSMNLNAVNLKNINFNF